jgi:hypothetical protein
VDQVHQAQALLAQAQVHYQAHPQAVAQAAVAQAL